MYSIFVAPFFPLALPETGVLSVCDGDARKRTAEGVTVLRIRTLLDVPCVFSSPSFQLVNLGLKYRR